MSSWDNPFYATSWFHDAVISVITTENGGEGIESKTYINITGGQTTIVAADDAINASYIDDTKSLSNAGDFTIADELMEMWGRALRGEKITKDKVVRLCY